MTSIFILILFEDDSSRVKLDVIYGDPDTSYVNASYIPVSQQTAETYFLNACCHVNYICSVQV